ncbi:MAG: chalcone isomerase family protein [Acidobacteriota bacterium]
MRRIAVVVLALMLLGGLVYAKELQGVTMPDQVTVGPSTLALNGMGVRIKKVAFIGIKVYVAGLYLPARSSNPEAILKTDEPKQIVMHFLYKDVGKDKLVEGWTEGFQKNSPGELAALKARLDTFNGYWSAMKTGDVAVLTYVPGTGTKVEIKGQEMGVIEGADFARALFAIWLGPNPPNKELKEGLLGK